MRFCALDRSNFMLRRRHPVRLVIEPMFSPGRGRDLCCRPPSPFPEDRACAGPARSVGIGLVGRNRPGRQRHDRGPMNEYRDRVAAVNSEALGGAAPNGPDSLAPNGAHGHRKRRQARCDGVRNGVIPHWLYTPATWSDVNNVDAQRMKPISIPPTFLDRTIAKAAARYTSPLIQNCARGATWAADGKVLSTAVAGIWLMSRSHARRQRAASTHLALTVAAAMLVPKLIKRVVDQERPDRCMVGPDRRGVGTSGKPLDSFPSGHSVHIGPLVAALSWAYPNKTRLFWSLGSAIAATRNAVLAHWPSDVFVGWALGAALERVVRRLTPKQQIGFSRSTLPLTENGLAANVHDSQAAPRSLPTAPPWPATPRTS